MTRKKWTLIVASLITLALPAMMLAVARRQSAQQNSSDKKNQTLKVDVDLVLVNATVTASTR